MAEERKKKLDKAILVRLTEREHLYLQFEAGQYEVSMARMLVQSFLHAERPTRELMRQREEAIFHLLRLCERLDGLRKGGAALDADRAFALDWLLDDAKTALARLGAAFSRKGDSGWPGGG
ncbi:MAG TPA: hypothetical protein VIP46_16925 [Pyrinomonadaceae bacterium]